MRISVEKFKKITELINQTYCFEGSHHSLIGKGDSKILPTESDLQENEKPEQKPAKVVKPKKLKPKIEEKKEIEILDTVQKEVNI